MDYLAPITDTDLEPQLVTDVREALEKNIVGYEDIKFLICKIVDASINKPEFKKVHLCLVGEKSTGKTVIVKTVFEAMSENHCVYYDASMASRVGLLDHLYQYGQITKTPEKSISILKNIKFVCLDEIDKMPKAHQFGILNLLESGVMMETKFKRNREVDARGITVIGTGNELNRIYSPLASRFYVVEMPKYTPQQFDTIGMTLLRRMNIDYVLSTEIMEAIDKNLPDKTIRDVVKVGTLVDNTTDLDTIIRIARRRIDTS